MVSKKTLIFFVALLLFMPEKTDCKFEKIEQFLEKYEVSKITELRNKFRIKFPTFENAERSIEIKGFGKSFILDLSIYFHHEDAEIEYISRESNTTGRYQDLKALLYQGHVRDTNESFALGFFTHDNLFRGYFITDEIYCVEPHEDKKASVIIYKLSGVIFPGCSKTDKGDGIDCSKTKYFEPWKPFKPISKIKFDYRVWYDNYLQLFSGPEYQKAKNETHSTKDISNSKGINNDPDDTKNDRKTGDKDKNNSSTVNEYDIKDKKHHNDTENELGNENNNHHNQKKNKYDKKESIKTIDTKHRNATTDGEEKPSDKFRQNKDELGRWLSISNGNHSEKNETDRTHKNNNNGRENKTHSNVDRDHEDEGDDKIHLSKYSTNLFQINSSTTNQDLIHSTPISEHHNSSHAKNETAFSFKSSTKFIESSKEKESPDTVTKEHPIKFKKGKNFNGNEEISDLNSVNNIELSVNSIAPNVNFPTKSSENVTSAGLNSILYNTKNLENNFSNFVTDISSLKVEDEEKAFASSSPEKKSVQKRHVFDDLEMIPYASIDGYYTPPVELECSLEIFISPAFRKKFDYQDADAIKDIFTQITLVNKLFQKVVLKRKGMPFHAIFRIEKLVVYKDEAYSPFEMKGELEDVVRYFLLQKRTCLSIGLMNQILKNPLQFVDGYLPQDEGGACSGMGNFFVVSHGDEVTPAPMGLYFAALIRGLTRVFGANDDSEKCKKGDLPNPMLVLRDNLLTKQITPGKRYSIFTECNIQEIEKALKDRKCLVELADPLCGNAIIDKGEECDCGPGYICQSLDSCCIAHLTAQQKFMAWLANGTVPQACKLVSEAQCGRYQPCCDNCLVRPEEEQKLCYYGTGSCDMAYCDGKHADCPISANASDSLICDGFSTTKLEPVLCKNKRCEFGLCTGSGLTPCTCASDTGKECLSCCMKDGKCKAAVSELHLIKGEDFPLLNGAKCTGGLCFRGRCVLEAGIQATNASDKNPAFMLRSNQVLIALNSLFATVITLSILLIVF